MSTLKVVATTLGSEPGGCEAVSSLEARSSLDTSCKGPRYGISIVEGGQVVERRLLPNRWKNAVPD